MLPRGGSSVAGEVGGSERVGSDAILSRTLGVVACQRSRWGGRGGRRESRGRRGGKVLAGSRDERWGGNEILCIAMLMALERGRKGAF